MAGPGPWSPVENARVPQAGLGAAPSGPSAPSQWLSLATHRPSISAAPPFSLPCSPSGNNEPFSSPVMSKVTSDGGGGGPASTLAATALGGALEHATAHARAS